MRIYVFATNKDKKQLKEGIIYDAERGLFLQTSEKLIKPNNYFIPENSAVIIDIIDGTPFPDKYKNQSKYYFFSEKYVKERVLTISKLTPIKPLLRI